MNKSGGIEPGVIGVAGCGNMGLPMARRLHQGGFDIWGFDVRPLSEFGDFQDRMIEDPGAFADRVDTVISVVRDWHQTEDLCFDDQAVFNHANAPRTLIVSSTLSPGILAPLKNRLGDGTVLLDAPMSGAPYRAADGTLTFMVGGEAEDVNALTPAFKAMGRDIHHLGACGAGFTCKVVNNFVASSSVVAVRRALKAAKALGVDQKTMLDVMRSSSGGSWFGDNFDDIDWAHEGYDPANTMGILEKDMSSFLDAMSGVPDYEQGSFEDAILDNLRKMEKLFE